MTHSFEQNNYSITSSLNERTIYIKVIDKVTFMCYDNNIDAKELRLSIDLNDSYQLINKCFSKNNGYNVTFTINSGIMKMNFGALIEGYLKLNFEVILREKVMSNDSQLTMNFHRIEQTQAQAIQMLTQRLEQLEVLVDAVSYAEIYMLKTGFNFNTTNHQNGQPYHCHKLWYNVNLSEMVLKSGSWDYIKIKLFYKLTKLTLDACPDISNFKTSNISNKSIKEMHLINVGGLTSFVGLDGFPELERIYISTCPSLKDIVSVFNSYKHKINYINIKSCAGINNTELMTYCQKNNIKLELA